MAVSDRRRRQRAEEARVAIPQRRPWNFLTRGVRVLGRQSSLDDVGDVLATAMDRVLERVPERERLTNFLHGTWLGHPLHPAITDVPVGAWTVAAVLDLVPSRRPRRTGPAAAIAIGIVGAAAAVPAGLVDWRHLSGEQRRIGVAHAGLNTLALSCYLASLVSRLLGRGPARRFAFAGYSIAAFSAYLGGHLVFDRQVGVRHESAGSAPSDFVSVASESDVKEGELTRADANGFPVLLARSDGQVYAVADVCTHLACSLSGGRLDGTLVQCPCHGSRFSILDGQVAAGPATTPLDSLETRVVGGMVEVKAKGS
jgi:nitrite reductase/ring-hydroxylating ferredoxin subunit/uncharacterized membrane protein